MRYLIALILFCSSVAYGDETSIKYGLGAFHSAEPSPGLVKLVSLTWQRPAFNEHLIQQTEGGFFIDAAGGDRRSSAFAFQSFGLNVNVGYFYVQNLIGAGFITCPDSYLGGPFQFTEDLAIGVKDEHGYSIGLDYKHISSAGIYPINRGRDFFTLRLSVPF